MEIDDMYQLYVNDLYRYLYSLSKDHYVAEDLVHETFYRAFLHMDEAHVNIKAWLFKVAYHAFIDFIRKNKRMIISDQVTDGQIHEKAEPIENSPESQLLEKESFQLLLNDIHSLRENQKNALLLCDFHKLTNQEAAEVLDININTLKSHLLRGREKMVEKIRKRREKDERER
ncbi:MULTISPECIES: sigma-70 family RNA polymerase sigma factor [Bacillaceae]|uniref:Sigma-70 family RNA polymerase sigma factor n=1 Tax=Evansella alkalicola TaxID=745819 RepID=A0ABS6JWD4_9BACI|nr:MULTISPECIES: sigma-70 family RNA polymerase sigma factor [Bacillaceae]MBU9722808.1 sigma-70 family RNA polymerase sigma factor [Bacillus alkalicola]